MNRATSAAGGGPRPAVSAILTNHNYGHFVATALDSVLAQDYDGPVEIIVVDDGSTDGSMDALLSYGDRVAIIGQDNRGQLLALREGMARARGEILCFLDADDAWTPDRVARTVAAFATPGVRWVAHGLRIADANLEPNGPAVPPAGRMGRLPGDPLLFLERRAGTATSALAVRADLARELVAAVDHAGREYAGMLRHDADRILLALVGVARSPGWQLADPLALYRRHAGQQFAGTERRIAMLERQVEVDGVVAELMSRSLGRRLVPTALYRHRLVIAGLTGAAGRPRLLLAGLAAALRLLPRHPLLAGRQALSLLAAAVAPRAWYRRMAAGQGLES
ncbi:MAG TPA: glycosyltransferase family A protein [Longimicrobiales bacterium]|nr:glycosyltransferase family A protein [Longimicrobiales bacterium]